MPGMADVDLLDDRSIAIRILALVVHVHDRIAVPAGQRRVLQVAFGQFQPVLALVQRLSQFFAGRVREIAAGMDRRDARVALQFCQEVVSIAL